MAGNSAQPRGEGGGAARDAAANEGSREGLSESLLRPAERERSMSSGRSPEPVARQGSAAAIASFVRSVSMKLRGKEDQKQVSQAALGNMHFIEIQFVPSAGGLSTRHYSRIFFMLNLVTEAKHNPFGPWPGPGRTDVCGGSMACACTCAESQPLLSSQTHGSMVWGPEMLAELMEVLPHPMPYPLLQGTRLRKQSPLLVSFSLSAFLSLCLFIDLYLSLPLSMSLFPYVSIQLTV
jgi:hypothetical protein